ncbi:MAG: glutamine--fructose-6-phosphate transaminase (isomerizing) [Armatimonadetes bacterium]|nr:glutamine--fructose-6-phosphate transaminase (isomerizing) [Armatimonadota bacterium]
MCGITGYVGKRQSLPIVMDQLKRLEYRGYDSSGVALLENGSVHVLKSVGKIRALQDMVERFETQSTTGIGHTRWATHGAPSDANAHPHMDCTGRFAVVHNGIIENYLELREELQMLGHQFKSETDTEVLSHLVEELYEGDLVQTVEETIKKVHGSYAMAVVSNQAKNRIVVARNQSPLVIGLGDGEMFLASDIPAVMPYTRRVLLLEDGDVAIMERDHVEVRHGGKAVERPPFEVTWDEGSAEKAGYEHFMLKEIHEQPQVIRNTLRGRIDDEGTVHIRELEPLEEAIRGAKRVVIAACGTAYHAGCVGKLFMERMLRVPVEIDLASEFRYREPIVDEETLGIVVSQSGETADTLAALREMKGRGAKVVAVVNVVGSSIAREADVPVYTWAGPEICVASTKAYTTQLAVMYLLGLHFANVRGVALEETARLTKELETIPDCVATLMERDDEVERIAATLTEKEDFFFLGRGMDFAVSLEGALKLKEITYLHAEAYAAGEMKHGPLALISPDVPVICLVTSERLREKMISNIKEMKARGGCCLGFLLEGDLQTEQVVDSTFRLPVVDELLMPILSVVPLQMLAYFLARDLGREIDQPRNLAKSVTVE